ncbi:Mu transposase C-terminal domain-containing protein [Rhodovulum adriaticum]|uniref:Putative transposase n=1 Tax=Rhodovulum adriaticum TaxID=35804 RepID=A0A4V2SL64_RHOAD|nr:Mu transposase C-terminal domain-containing protein [Rhodovulum adriaticum]MBK1636497.1 transposase [Rhodovulum adriaticum]TCP22196.1 putative transposase [Rhodovulum adriaticum]
MDIEFNPEGARYAFGAFDRITINGEAWRMTYEKEDGYVLTMVDGAQLSQDFSHEQLSRLGNMGRIRVDHRYYHPDSAARRLRVAAPLIATLGEMQRARLVKRSAYVQAFLELERKGLLKRTDASITASTLALKGTAMGYAARNLNPSGKDKPGWSANLANAPSARTLRAWVKAYEEFGEGGLVDAMHRKGNRGRQLAPEEQGLMMKEVRRYLGEERLSQKQVHENVIGAFTVHNAERQKEGRPPLTIPSRETVRRAIHSLDAYAVERARKGEGAARKKFRPVGAGIELTRPLERVEIDEWTIDLISLMHSTGLVDLLSEEELQALGLDGKKSRWFLTVAMCATTRCIVGMTMSRTPGAEAALQTLEMVVSDKGRWSDAVGALGFWSMSGLPELIVTDAGRAFNSELFRFACSDLGIASEITVAGFPELRGRIERVFNTMSMHLLPRLSGRTFSDVATKGDSDPAKRAALTVEDLTFALVRWVVDIYHNMPHDGLGGETPAACWKRLEKQWGVQPPPDMRRMRLVFGRRMARVLDKEGITILGVRYHSERLGQAMIAKGPHTVPVRWHPKDIGTIEVCLGKEWFGVPAVEDGLDGVPAQTWMTACRTARSRKPKGKLIEREIVHAAIKDITRRNEGAMALTGLLVEDWSHERIEREEKRLFIGFEVGDSPKPRKAENGVGSILPDPVEPAAPAKAKAKRPAPRKRRKGGETGFSIEED